MSETEVRRWKRERVSDEWVNSAFGLCARSVSLERTFKALSRQGSAKGRDVLLFAKSTEYEAQLCPFSLVPAMWRPISLCPLLVRILEIQDASPKEVSRNISSHYATVLGVCYIQSRRSGTTVPDK